MVEVFCERKRLLGVVISAFGVLFSGCGVVEDSARIRSGVVLSRTIEFASRYNIERAIITVFQGDGFEMQPGSGTGGTLRFVREGNALGEERFGEWFSRGVFLRVEVNIAEVEFGTHRVSSALEIGREDQFVTTRKGSRRVKLLLGRVERLAGVL